jgi:hypothetical protein
VVDSTTNFIEHPELIAERIGRYARLGRGTSCRDRRGFGTGSATPWTRHRLGQAGQPRKRAARLGYSGSLASPRWMRASLWRGMKLRARAGPHRDPADNAVWREQWAVPCGSDSSRPLLDPLVADPVEAQQRLRYGGELVFLIPGATLYDGTRGRSGPFIPSPALQHAPAQDPVDRTGTRPVPDWPSPGRSPDAMTYTLKLRQGVGSTTAVR